MKGLRKSIELYVFDQLEHIESLKRTARLMKSKHKRTLKYDAILLSIAVHEFKTAILDPSGAKTANYYAQKFDSSK